MCHDAHVSPSVLRVTLKIYTYMTLKFVFVITRYIRFEQEIGDQPGQCTPCVTVSLSGLIPNDDNALIRN